MPCGRPTRPRCSNLDKDNFKLDRWPHLREDRSLDTCLIVRAPVISGCDSAIRVRILTRYLLIPTAPISTRFHPLDYPGCDWRVARTCWWNARQRTGGRATPALNMSWCRWLDVGCVLCLCSLIIVIVVVILYITATAGITMSTTMLTVKLQWLLFSLRGRLWVVFMTCELSTLSLCDLLEWAPVLLPPLPLSLFLSFSRLNPPRVLYLHG